VSTGDSQAPNSGEAIQDVRPWAALAFRDFRLLWIHGVFNGIARHMRELLTFYLVYDLSGSAVDLGITGLFQAAPVIVLGLFGGALADSANRKTVLLLTQAVTLSAMALFTALLFVDFIEVWHIWVFTSFSSGVGILGRPAQRAFMPRLVPPSHIVNAVTWYGALSQGTLFVGPFIAGVVVAIVGIGWAYLLVSVLMGLGLAATSLIRTSGTPEGARPRVSLRAMWEGIQFVRLNGLLLSTFAIDLGVMSVGFFRPLLPILALDVFEIGEVGLGVLGAAPAAGAILGTATLLAMGDFRRKGVVVIAAYFGYTASLLVLGLAALGGDSSSSVLWVGLALLAMSGLGFTDVVSFTAKQSLLQIVTPDNYRGRASSLSSILSSFGNGTGAMEMGGMAALLGAPGALIISSFVGAGLAAAVALRWRSLWRWGL
jgi:MFS family permease